MQNLFKKYLVPCLLVIALVGASTIPYNYAEAQRATTFWQAIQNVQLKISSMYNTITAANTGIVAANSTSLLVKENLLDGIGWAIAKQMVSSMTQSLINWINSGFQGSPAFITDLNGFLLDALDTAAGEYIKGLGGIGSLICSPFKLDVQAALSINYDSARSGMPTGATTPMCRLTDIEKNIEGFLNGIGENGWEDWLEITSNPQNTPYGSYLEAEAKLSIRLKNEAGQEIEIANWGQGFLSKRVCEAIEGKPNGKGANCKITTPGQVISEALTFQLSTGPRALIEADEINEVIGALINQLALQAMKGVNGLLGMGGNTAYADYTYAGAKPGQSYVDAANAQNQALYANTETIKAGMDDSLTTEKAYQTLTNDTIVRATNMLQDRGILPNGGKINPAAPTPTYPSEQPSTTDLVNFINTLTAEKNEATSNITKLDALISRYNNAAAVATSTNSVDAIRQQIVFDYVDLINTGTLTSSAKIETRRIEWDRVFQYLN